MGRGCGGFSRMDKAGYHRNKRVGGVALALLLAVGAVHSVCARDVFVMLSGGDSPMNNNYSQYLQAKAGRAYFLGSHPGNSGWVFFWAGKGGGRSPARSA